MSEQWQDKKVTIRDDSWISIPLKEYQELLKLKESAGLANSTELTKNGLYELVACCDGVELLFIDDTHPTWLPVDHVRVCNDGAYIKYSDSDVEEDYTVSEILDGNTRIRRK